MIGDEAVWIVRIKSSDSDDEAAASCINPEEKGTGHVKPVGHEYLYGQASHDLA